MKKKKNKEQKDEDNKEEVQKEKEMEKLQFIEEVNDNLGIHEVEKDKKKRRKGKRRK